MLENYFLAWAVAERTAEITVQSLQLTNVILELLSDTALLVSRELI
jgi:hypothetical protein